MKTILIINDNDSIIENISRLITSMGHKVYFAKSAEDGFRIVNTFNVNMIVYNIEKHCCKAYELFEEFSKNVRTQFIPFIFLNSACQIKNENNKVYETVSLEEVSENSKMRSLPFAFINALSQNKGKMILIATLDSSCFICPFDDADLNKVISGNYYEEMLNGKRFDLLHQFEKLVNKIILLFVGSKDLLVSRNL